MNERRSARGERFSLQVRCVIDAAVQNSCVTTSSIYFASGNYLNSDCSREWKNTFCNAVCACGMRSTMICDSFIAPFRGERISMRNNI